MIPKEKTIKIRYLSKYEDLRYYIRIEEHNKLTKKALKEQAKEIIKLLDNVMYYYREIEGNVCHCIEKKNLKELKSKLESFGGGRKNGR